MDLATTYLGLRLTNPLVVGAGPLCDDLDTARALEDNGASMLVVRSLFEEEITSDQLDAFNNVERFSESFAEASSFEPDSVAALGPYEYLEHVQALKRAVSIPVMASLNGSTPGGWCSYADLIEQAGADGLELHIYHAASDISLTAADVERRFLDIVREVKGRVRIPVAVKIAPLQTAFANFAAQLDAAGADGLVLFTRFQRADIDIEELEIVQSLPLSDSSELTMRLRGAAAVSGRIRASIAITGGVHTPIDVIKSTMAGAHATQMVSALLRNGPGHLLRIRRGVEAWMREHEWSSLSEMRGNMSLQRVPDPAAYERANFRTALR
jgi:dihydroorotate dehydrogenase (fumarate)